MPMSISDAIPGAYIEEFFDERGKPLPVRRRGYIVKVTYPEDAAYDNTAVNKVYAKFEEGKEPEPIKLARVNLVRRADERSMVAVKNNMAVSAAEIAMEKAKAAAVPGYKESGVRPVSVDQTGVMPSRAGYTPEQAKEIAKR